MSTRDVGRLSVVVLCGSRGRTWPWESGSSVDSQRDLARAFDPAASATDGRWLLDFRAFAIRPGHVGGHRSCPWRRGRRRRLALWGPNWRHRT